MGVIESEEAAKRLARVIVSDIELYNRDKFRAGADLTHEISEGLALFRSRVAPALVPIFDTVLADKREAAVAGGGAPKSAASPAPAAGAPPAKSTAAPVPADDPASAASGPVFAARVPSNPVAAPAMAPKPAAAPPAAVAAPEPPPAPAAPAPVPVAAAPAPTPAPVAPNPALAPAPAAPAPAPAAAARPAGSRQGPIDTEEAAARLARVIVSDIQLYNAKKIAAGADLSGEIEEGRALFKSRVAPAFAPLFDTTLAAKGLGDKRQPPPAAEARAPVAPAPSPAATLAPRKVAATPPPAPLRAEAPARAAGLTPPPLPVRPEPVSRIEATARSMPAFDDAYDHGTSTPIPVVAAVANAAPARAMPAPAPPSLEDDDGDDERTPVPAVSEPPAFAAADHDHFRPDDDGPDEFIDPDAEAPVTMKVDAPSIIDEQPAPPVLHTPEPSVTLPPLPAVALPPVPPAPARAPEAPASAALVPSAPTALAAAPATGTTEVVLRPKTSNARTAITLVLLAAAGALAYYLLGR